MGSGKGKNKRVKHVITKNITSNHELLLALEREYSRKNYSEVEVETILKYVWSGSDLNKFLGRDKDLPVGSAYSNDNIEKEAAALQSLILSHKIITPVKLYRGLSTPRWYTPEDPNLAVGRMIDTKYFISTSIFSHGALDFAKRADSNHPVLLEFNYQGSGLWINGAASYTPANFSSEHEVLLPQNKTLKINQFLGMAYDPKVGNYARYLATYE